ncbi:MAG TPA: hypothetical protein VHL08_10820 [Dongiaceae bacterium]|nr:hypothetical protein [Dongiaceae bacterium]
MEVNPGTFPTVAFPALVPARRADAPSVNQSLPRYNSLEFVYRPEFRRIVVLSRNPATGDTITQSPPEHVLRLYTRHADAGRSTVTAVTA